ncbi:hypothetical protein NPIL_144721 [Nephila pilipes]|uniref:Uncharacterized protein n=1 Tax=Nephila pilipes TaxID=299642 RepID=A0A8X6PMM2_NEPPI|nr:hypothetical protein NPIL_144721 [Nephila pilipes]
MNIHSRKIPSGGGVYHLTDHSLRPTFSHKPDRPPPKVVEQRSSSSSSCQPEDKTSPYTSSPECRLINIRSKSSSEEGLTASISLKPALPEPNHPLKASPRPRQLDRFHSGPTDGALITLPESRIKRDSESGPSLYLDL